MKRFILAALIALALYGSTFAQAGATGKTYAPGTLTPTTIGALPSPGDPNRIWRITNAANSTDCTVGGGSTLVNCQWNGSVYAVVGGSGGGISGLTTNTVTKATSATTIGNSLTTDDGTIVTVNTTAAAHSTILRGADGNDAALSLVLGAGGFEMVGSTESFAVNTENHTIAFTAATLAGITANSVPIVTTTDAQTLTNKTAVGLLADNTSQLADFDVVALPGTCTSGKNFHRTGDDTFWKCLTAGNTYTQIWGANVTATAAAGGTGNSSYAVGDILYASAGTTLSKLADIATGNALISGGVTTAPSWGKIGLTTHVTGTLPVANGGTGLTTLTANNVILGNGTSTPGFVAPSTSGNVLTSNGTTWTSAAPAGGGTTINATNGVLPYRSDATTFLDSPLSVSTGRLISTATLTSSSVVPYLRIVTPVDTGQTVDTEFTGMFFGGDASGATVVRTTADGTTIAVNRESRFIGPTHAAAGATTITDDFTVGMTPPVQGTNMTITRGHTLGILDSTSATSPITGGLIVATTFGTTATSVGIGAGKIEAGSSITAGGTITSGGNVSVAAASSLKWAGRSQMASTADGVITMADAGGAQGFLRLVWGNFQATNAGAAIAFDAVNGFSIKSGANTDTYNDASTANSGTVANRCIFCHPAPTLTSTGTSVTYTVANNVYIAGAPVDSTNVTSTTKWALNVAAGNATFGGKLFGSTNITDAAGTPGSVCYNTATFELTKNNALTCTVSASVFKRGIAPLNVSALSLLDQVRPVQFAYKDQPNRTRWGFIAEQVGSVDRRLADGYNAVGSPQSLDQNAILSLTVKAMQEMQSEIVSLKAEVKSLRIARLRHRR